MLDKLRSLAAISLRPSPGEADVVDACTVVADALGAAEAYVLRAGDPHFVRIGSQEDPAQYPVKQRGYWLMWRELARMPELLGGIGEVKDRLVHRADALAAGATGNYFAMILPGPESNSDILIVDRGTDSPVTTDEESFLATARPILCQLIDKVLDSERRERQQRQLSTLADVAVAFNNAEHMETALSDLATAIATASGFDWVSIVIYDDKLENVVDQGLNVARHANTDTATFFRKDLQREKIVYPRLPRYMREGQPALYPDVFAPDAGLAPALQQYWERAHINSMAWFPLMFQGRALGTIDFSSSTKRDFNESEVLFLTALTAQAATAVKGMMLYRDLERSRNEILRYAEKLEESSHAEHFLARTDALTGMPNRRYLEEVLKAESARSSRYHEPISVVMADVDYFKQINDQYGHPVGDEALRFVARIARECSRASDFVGRWGGDEFLIILPQTTADAAFIFADRFRKELGDRAFRAEAGEQVIRIPISAGVADACPPPAADSTVLVSRADKALYDAKEGGRDQVRYLPSTANAA